LGLENNENTLVIGDTKKAFFSGNPSLWASKSKIAGPNRCLVRKEKPSLSETGEGTAL
jgi:hypothetical protein